MEGATMNTTRVLEIVVELERLRSKLHNELLLADVDPEAREVVTAIDALTRYAGYASLREQKNAIYDRLDAREAMLAAVVRMGQR
jgi:hypothetical protein